MTTGLGEGKPMLHPDHVERCVDIYIIYIMIICRVCFTLFNDISTFMG